MHWLTYVRLDRKDRLKNMRGTTLEEAMIADISRAPVRFLVFSNVWLGPSDMNLLHSFLDELDSWLVNTLVMRPLNLNNLLWITS